MRVLGIETSCDETGVAIFDERQGLLADALYSQVAIHSPYGGVVPELASRDHIRRLLPLIERAYQQGNCEPGDIDGVAYTAGPGLIGALLVGASVARSLAYARGVPAVGIHHMEGHLLSAMLEERAPGFPFVALLVSGGHTMLVEVSGLGRYRTLGQTLDDAVGEAFDKTAKSLGLPYPGGPALAALAERGRPGQFVFPRPMLDRPGLDFSFSGLKTAVQVTLRDLEPGPRVHADIALAFQEAVVDTLVTKCRRALEQTDIRSLVVAGGVGANRVLRERLVRMTTDIGCEVFYPRPEFCTDNGAMIAYAGLLRLTGGQVDDYAIQARARWVLDDLRPPSANG